MDLQRTTDAKGRDAMGEIRWETELDAALAKARQSGKPVFLDFWFDG
jgi:thiol:disulfide interchange protein